MHPFSTPLERVRKGALGTNGLTQDITNALHLFLKSVVSYIKMLLKTKVLVTF